MTTNVNKINLKIWGIISFLYGIGMIYLLDNYKSDNLIPIGVISSLFLLILQIKAVYSRNKLLITPGFIYLISYYVFQNGQLLLYSMSVEFNMFYLDRFSSELTEGAIFSSISNVIAGYIYLYVTTIYQNKLYICDSIDKYYTTSEIKKVAIQGCIATGFVAIPLILYKFSFALAGGYMAVRSAESAIPSVLNFVEYMFPAFAILSLIYNKDGNKLIHIIFLIWLILTALCGDRTTGLAGILILIFLKYKFGHRTNTNNLIIFGVGAILIIYLVSFIANFRKAGAIVDGSSDTSFIISFLSELGFSVVPLLTIIDICPKQLPFQYGLEYIQSFIGGCIPSFIDPTGTITYINSLSRNYESFQSTYFGIEDFGIGWSLNAEAFHNFGWYGLVSLIFINYIVFRFLNRSHYSNLERDFNLYSVCALLFMWITLPRRDSYYIWKAIVYTIIFIRFYIRVRCQRNSK